ncbi:ankyrin repeat domain-containing protein [bacterium]|nr:ankyrin repeat domain-containing protein [bacterium]
MDVRETIRKNDLETVKKLLAEKKDVNIRNDTGDTFLHIAVRMEKKEVAELLINKSAEINAKNNGEITPLHLAASRGYTDIGKLLIDKGADINIENNYGETPLHLAVREGHAEIAKLLIESGAIVNAQNNKGITPLDIAFDTYEWWGFDTQILKMLQTTLTGNFMKGTEPEGFFRESYLGTIKWGTSLQMFHNMDKKEIEVLQSLYEYHKKFENDEQYGKIVHALSDMTFEELDQITLYEKRDDDLKFFGITIEKIQYVFWYEKFLGVIIYRKDASLQKWRDFVKTVFSKYGIGLEIGCLLAAKCDIHPSFYIWSGKKTKMVLTRHCDLFIVSTELMKKRQKYLDMKRLDITSKMKYVPLPPSFYYEEKEKKYYLIPQELDVIYISKGENNEEVDKFALRGKHNAIKKDDTDKYWLTRQGWQPMLLGKVIDEEDAPITLQRLNPTGRPGSNITFDEILNYDGTIRLF